MPLLTDIIEVQAQIRNIEFFEAASKAVAGAGWNAAEERVCKNEMRDALLACISALQHGSGQDAALRQALDVVKDWRLADEIQ